MVDLDVERGYGYKYLDSVALNKIIIQCGSHPSLFHSLCLQSQRHLSLGEIVMCQLAHAGDFAVTIAHILVALCVPNPANITIIDMLK